LTRAEDTAPLRRRHQVAELRTPGVHASITRLRRLRTPHGRDRPARQPQPGHTTRTPTSEVTTLTRSQASAHPTTPYPTGVSRPHPYGFTIAHHPVKDGNRHDDGLVPGTHPGFRAAPL